jgi:predicted adenylyl cyclase CyaB
MSSNIEIKARADDFSTVATIIKNITDTPGEEIHQEDVFFKTSKGRLKLRIFDPENGELIYYERENTSRPKQSNYVRFHTNQPLAMKETFSNACGVVGIVRKHRTLYKVGNTRVHIDTVEGLGNFLELEVVLSEGQDAKSGFETIQYLMKTLSIKESDLIPCAYIDLLIAEQKAWYHNLKWLFSYLYVQKLRAFAKHLYQYR